MEIALRRLDRLARSVTEAFQGNRKNSDVSNGTSANCTA
jgi:hypothetical protein